MGIHNMLFIAKYLSLHDLFWNTHIQSSKGPTKSPKKLLIGQLNVFENSLNNLFMLIFSCG